MIMALTCTDYPVSPALQANLAAPAS